MYYLAVVDVVLKNVAEPEQWIISIKTRKFCEKLGVDAVVALVAGAKRWEIPVRVNFR